MDPTTELLMAGWRVDDGPIQLTDFALNENAGIYELRELLKDPSVLVYAHNAFFEANIIEYVAAPRKILPYVPIERFRCTATLASAARYPKSLDACSKALGLIEKKDAKGTALINRFSVPVKPTLKHKSDRWLPEEDPERWYQFRDYCKQDVVVESAIHEKFAKFELSDYEQRVYAFTYRANQRGLQIDIDAVEAALKLNEEYEARMTEEFTDLTNGLTPGQVGELAKWAGMESVAKAKIEEQLADPCTDAVVRRALEIRLALAKTSNKKLIPMLKAAGFDNRMRGSWIYYGAPATGRFAGAVIQIQNYPRPTIKGSKKAVEDLKWMSVDDILFMHGEVPEVTSSCLRHMIRAADGHKYIISDFAGVEARGVMWFCEEHEAVQMFRDDIDIYKSMGSFIFNTPIEDITKGGLERFVGKQAILGCGYGMGWKKFQASCAGYGQDLSDELSKQAVDGYRAKYSLVKAMWGNLARMWVNVVKTGKTAEFNKGCKMGISGDYLIIKLPSGRNLVYPFPDATKEEVTHEGRTWNANKISFMTENSTTKKWQRHTIHGGFILENIVQAFCRDFMVHSMLTVEETGFPVVATIHDEVISEVPEDKVDIIKFDKAMLSLPAWGHDFPMGVETNVSGVYQK